MKFQGFQLILENMNNMNRICRQAIKAETETTDKTTDKTALKADEKILILIKDRPGITQTEIAEILDTTVEGVRYQIDKMKRQV